MKKKIIVSLVAIFLLAFLPFGVIYSYAYTIGEKYDETYLRELPDKYNRLVSTDSKKIVFVGGSSLAFGLRSDLISQELDYETVNFGLYGTLGTKLMMDLSKEGINEGDIVILAPELSDQTYSLYFNPLTTLEATEAKPSLRSLLSSDEKLELFYNSFKYINEKRKMASNPNLSEPYCYSAFNEYGDIKTTRPSNTLPLDYDASNLFSYDVSSIDKDFISYVNKYIKFVEKHKATIFFSYSPVNNLAAKDSTTLDKFHTDLENVIDCDFLGTPEDFTYDYRYFYDTNFHLTDSGAIMHSSNLVDALKSKLGDTTTNDIIVPDYVEKNTDTILDVEDDTYGECFDYVQSGSRYYIKNIKREYMYLSKLTLPTVYEDKPVVGLLSGALANMVNIEEITIPKSYALISNNAFNGCRNLVKIVFLYDYPNQVLCEDGFLLGTNRNVKIYLQASAFDSFSSDYTMYKYASYYVKVE